MNDSQWKILAAYVRDMADDIGLRDWFLMLSHEPCDDDAQGMVEPIYGRKCATIRVCEQFRDLESENQRHVIVHELMHCHLFAMADVVRVDLADANVLRQSEYELIQSSFKRATEYACDGIACDIARKYPLIEWGDEEI